MYGFVHSRCQKFAAPATKKKMMWGLMRGRAGGEETKRKEITNTKPFACFGAPPAASISLKKTQARPPSTVAAASNPASAARRKKKVGKRERGFRAPQSSLALAFLSIFFLIFQKKFYLLLSTILFFLLFISLYPSLVRAGFLSKKKNSSNRIH
jgi:hypothetical protein